MKQTELDKMLIKPPAVPQLRLYTPMGPIAHNLLAYKVHSEMIVSYISVDSDVVETNFGPCTIVHAAGMSYNAIEIDNRMNAGTAP